MIFHALLLLVLFLSFLFVAVFCLLYLSNIRLLTYMRSSFSLALSLSRSLCRCHSLRVLLEFMCFTIQNRHSRELRAVKIFGFVCHLPTAVRSSKLHSESRAHFLPSTTTLSRAKIEKKPLLVFVRKWKWKIKVFYILIP